MYAGKGKVTGLRHKTLEEKEEELTDLVHSFSWLPKTPQPISIGRKERAYAIPKTNPKAYDLEGYPKVMVPRLTGKVAQMMKDSKIDDKRSAAKAEITPGKR
jgi:hypothetical protein